MELSTEHKDLLQNAIKALHLRTFYAGYPEHPKAYPEDGDEKGRAAFKSHLGGKFEEFDTDADNWIGEEESPYTSDYLGISYPSHSVDGYLARAERTRSTWRNTPLDTRASVLLQSLEGFRDRFFEVAYATMHTTGQGYMMAFQASGPHAADRALEAVAAGYEEISRFPEEAHWDKPMGKFNIVLKKKWKVIPRGISVVIGCSTFPVWNSLPGVYASLITGNPVIVKPHPGAILPVAIVISEIRKALKAAGIDPDVCQMAPDTRSNPVTLDLAEDARVKIIDFTGNSEFGTQLEKLHGKEVFTEKTGVNSAILDSVADPAKVAANLAFSVCLYSGQMCTAPQNFFVPENGIATADGRISYDDFVGMLKEQITGLVQNPKAGPFVLGAIQNQSTCDRVKQVDQLDAKVLLESIEVENPMFPKARTLSPALLEVDVSKEDVFNKELFGPIALVIKTRDTRQSVELAARLTENQGAISCAAYTTDPEMKELMEEELGSVGAPVSFNLTGAIYVNQHAGFSDLHVTGANPAGNASLTDTKFVTRRFNWVGIREME